MVRRDWCGLTKLVGREVLEILLGDSSSETKCENLYEYFSIIGEKLSKRQFPLQNFVVYKQLKKMPNQYKDASGQPHVYVAKKLIEKKNYSSEQLLNHSIPFIICKKKINFF